MIDLKAKVGPFPVVVWGAIGGTAVAGYLWWTGRNASSAPTAATAATGTKAIDPGVLTGLYGYAPANVAGVDTAGAIVTAADTQTNFVWTASALTHLISLRYGPLEAQTALSKYLNGEMITPREAQMVDLVLAKFGMPPQGTYAQSVVDTSAADAVAKAAADAAAAKAAAESAKASTDASQRAQVAGYYSEYLGRPATDAEINTWLATGRPMAAIRWAIAASQEALVHRNWAPLDIPEAH